MFLADAKGVEHFEATGAGLPFFKRYLQDLREGTEVAMGAGARLPGNVARSSGRSFLQKVSSSMARKFRVAVIGAGYRQGACYRLSSMPEAFDVACVCDLNLARAEEAAGSCPQCPRCNHF